MVSPHFFFLPPLLHLPDDSFEVRASALLFLSLLFPSSLSYSPARNNNNKKPACLAK